MRKLSETTTEAQAGDTDERFGEDNESKRQILMEETSSDLSSVGDTLISGTQTSTMGSNLSTGTYWRQARLQQTGSGSGSVTTDEWDLSPGQRESIAQESQKEMQA